MAGLPVEAQDLSKTLSQSLPRDSATVSPTPAPTRILKIVQENDYKWSRGTATLKGLYCREGLEAKLVCDETMT